MHVLSRYIKEAILKEAANRNVQGMGLAVFPEGNYMKFVLYNVKQFVSIIKQTKKFPSKDEMLEIIKGYMFVQKPEGSGPCHGAWTVVTSGAVEGYGPTLYDIALALVPGNTLMPDIGGHVSVSPHALKVWQFYKNKRGDIEALPLDNIAMKQQAGSKPLDSDEEQEEQTPEKEDDCFLMPGGDEVLKYAYRMKGSPPFDINAMIGNHDKLLSKFGDKLSPKFNRLVLSAAQSYLGYATQMKG